MRGRHEILVRNRRVQYKFSIERNMTILCGDSATGKTTLIEMIATYQRNKEQSGVEIRADKPLVVLTEANWELLLASIHDSIVFIDEGGRFVLTPDFARMVQNSDNYYVIATRTPLYSLPYSVNEIYGIKNTAGNRYQGTKRLYAEFYPVYQDDSTAWKRPDLVIVEDSNAGFAFFSSYFCEKGIRCISAGGKANIQNVLSQEMVETILVIVDGAAFGSEIQEIMSLRKAREIILYMPESFEWLILKSDVLNDREIRSVLESPADAIDSESYFSWERFFTELLTIHSQGTYLQYSKRKLNPNYLQGGIVRQIEAVMPKVSEL